MKNIEVVWTGKYPNLCHGKWIIRIDEKPLKHTKKDTVMYSSMSTENTFNIWKFVGDYEVEWNEYTDGLPYKAWWSSETGECLNKLLEKNKVTLTEEEKKYFYEQLVEHDWRHNSCGGCI